MRWKVANKKHPLSRAKTTKLPEKGDKKLERKFAWLPVLTKDKKIKIWLEHYIEVYEYKEDKRPIGVKGTEYWDVDKYGSEIKRYREFEWVPFNRWILIDIK